MNTIDWLRESGKFLAFDRPDVYEGPAEAVAELSHIIERLRHINIEPVSSIMFTSYVMTRIVEDDVEEFLLSRKLSTLCIFPEEEVVTAISHDPRIDLPDVSDYLEEE